MASGRVTSLEDLPLEILTLICTYLCEHCYSYDINIWKPSCDWGGIIHKEGDNLRIGLKALTAVSQQLRRAARPILWHRIQPEESGPESRKQILRYIRFLQTNRDIKIAVKSLVIDGRDESCTCCPHWQDDLDDEEWRIVRRASRQTGLPIMMGGSDADESVELLVELLISMLPALTELHLAIPHTWTFDHLQVWRFKGVAMGEEPKRFLSNVRRLEFEVQGPEEAQCVAGHNECKAPTPRSPVEEMVIESAPRVEVLSCTAGGLNSLPLLPRLKYLELQPRGYWDKIERLFDYLPSLTHLKYCTANEHSPSPRKLQTALQPLSSTLEVLCVSVQRYMSRPSFGQHDAWEPPTDTDWVMDSLESFTSLKSLTIDAGMIWRGEGREGKRNFESRDDNKMENFLPSSIEIVFVDDEYGDVGPMLPLAQRAAVDLYPNLKRVLWYGVEEVGEIMMTLDQKDQDDWLSSLNWRSPICRIIEFSHVRALHNMSDGHLVAFPNWEELYQEQCRRHQEAT